MRDLLIASIIFGALPLALRAPYIGILLWSWVGYGNPHLYSWRIRDWPIAMIVAVVTLTGLLFSQEPKRIPWTKETVLLLMLWLWFMLTTHFAFYPENAAALLEKVSKILLMTFVTLMLFQDKNRFNLLFIVIALSLGSIAMWGMVWGIMTGGQQTYYGPTGGSLISDNNELALALNMILPFCIFIPKNLDSRIMRWGFSILFFASIFTIIITFSRGGFLGLCTVLLGSFLISRKKFRMLALIAIIILLGSMFIPERWFERMNTIEDYEADASAMGRINAWWVAFFVAKDRPFLGGGFEMFSAEQFEKYAPDPNDVHDVHSIYFEVLGEHGFAGLFLYLSLIVASMASLLKMAWRLQKIPASQWYVNYCNMLMVSIMAFLVNGAFLGRAYFDLFFHLIAGTILLQAIFKKEVADLLLQENAPGDHEGLQPAKVQVDHVTRKSPGEPAWNPVAAN